MTAPETIAKGIRFYPGDCLDVLPTLAETSIDSVVTDPPYHLSEIPHAGRGGLGGDRDEERKQARRGFMGKQWDGGDIAFRAELWAEVFRVLKPGAHLVAFGGTRTYHRMACAIEDAGFEIRDCIFWLYGSGFPKSHDVSKGIDRAAGVEQELISVVERTGKETGIYGAFGGPSPITTPATDAARQWQGWGTALKPACEPIVLARKPLSEGTVAANVLKWGTGAINVDGCRVEHSEECKPMAAQGDINSIYQQSGRFEPTTDLKPNGRWPANVVHDGSDEVTAAFPDAPGQQRSTGPEFDRNANVYGKFAGVTPAEPRGDSGSAARFFYTAKADADDRLGSKHPTVKPLDLMQWLVRLVTPKGGLVLDPFAGTGTTGEAAFREGFRAVLIEREAEYQADIRRRMVLALSGPDERSRESIKARGLTADAGPLFRGLQP